MARRSTIAAGSPDAAAAPPSPACGPGDGATTTSGRLMSLDAFRGLAMLLMISEGFGLAEAAARFPNSGPLQFLGRQTTHVRWQGCHFWDLIMPAFIFSVGVALPFSVASRIARGQPALARSLHVLARSLLLVLLGFLVFSNASDRTQFSFINVLCQIGLAYPFACLLVGRRRSTQLAAAVFILAAYGGWFHLHPLPAKGFDYASVGVPADWEHPPAPARHWDLNTNPAAAFDRWFLNLFPRPEPFRFRAGGGTTLNFVPTIVTMVLGVMVGEMLRRPLPDSRKLRGMLLAGVAALIAGIALDPAILPGVHSMRWTLCPIVKRLWTPSWVLFSGGCVILSFACLYWIVERHRLKAWTFPLVVVGMNSLVMYLLAALAGGWIARTLRIHLGPAPFEGAFGPVVRSLCVVIVLWLFCLWLYRRRIFIRI